VAARPRRLIRVIVVAGDGRPGVAGVFALEEPLRRGARVPDVRLARVAGREPEDVIDGAAARLALRELRRRRRFLPCLAAVERAHDDRAEVARANAGEHRLLVTRIEDRVMDDVTEMLRPLESEALAVGAADLPETFAGADEECDRRHGGPMLA